MTRPKKAKQDADSKDCTCRAAPGCAKCFTSKVNSVAQQSYSLQTYPVQAANSTNTYPSLIFPVQAPPTNTAPAPFKLSFEEMISNLSTDKVRQLLLKLCGVSPTAQSYVRTSYAEQSQATQLQLAQFQPLELRRAQSQSLQVRQAYPLTPDIDFQPYSAAAWQALNNTYSNLRYSQQFGVSNTAFDEVEGYIRHIGNKTPQAASFGTKLSALEALQKIGESIIMTGDTLASELRKQYQHEGSNLGEVMLRITESMTPEERRQAAVHTADEKGNFLIDKIRWVRDEAQKYSLEALDVSEALGFLEDPDEQLWAQDEQYYVDGEEHQDGEDYVNGETYVEGIDYQDGNFYQNRGGFQDN
ncbi:hypothetical protein F5Y19DRAFT_493546 [Xylariaceae sp. FL1651]|nr:hypothetical protein F5Y19DRAFT_493546 [Xylariaceae sp. FL1651]